MAAVQSQAPATLDQLLPPLVLGGAGFSYQHISNPSVERTREVVARAFELGVNAIDTSAYYEPSEELLGEALSHPKFTARYKRQDYMLMTKVGRVSVTKSDYSPEWIRYSVNRSIQRLRTSYLDVVFCHDIEFVTEEEALQAIGILMEMVEAGTVRYIGISGYPINTLAGVARRARNLYGRPLDIIQNWAQMTLQNNRLEEEGLEAFREAGVQYICSSSPLVSGLLRDEGVPIAALGDWHPAPEGLRMAAHTAAMYVASQGRSLARLALQYAIQRAQSCSTADFHVSIIIGGTSVGEVEENISTALGVLHRDGGLLQWNHKGMKMSRFTRNNGNLDLKSELESDSRVFADVQEILGEWMNYSFGDICPKRKSVI